MKLTEYIHVVEQLLKAREQPKTSVVERFLLNKNWANGDNVNLARDLLIQRRAEKANVG